MTDTNLKPCPFCGGKATLIHIDEGTMQVICDDCGSCSDCYDEKWNPDIEVIDAWNTRPIESKLKSDNVKLIMTNKLLKKRIERLEEALQAIMEATEKDFPSLKGISLVAYMALEEEDND